MKVLGKRKRLDDAGATALFVVHDEPESVRSRMLADLDVGYPVLVDRERSAYQRWGLGRAPFWTVYLDPKVWRQYARLLRGGEQWRGAGRDTLQLGGDFVVAPSGTLVYSRPQKADNRPAVGELVRAVEQAAHQA